MIEDKIGVLLHQKSFRGEKLTKEEAEQLQVWYAQQDEEEVSILNLNSSGSIVGQLRTQISDILTQISQLTNQIQLLAKENEKIREENARLFKLLAQKTKAA